MESPHKKENTIAYKYVQILRAFLYPIGGWPGEVFGEKVSILVKYHKIHVPIQTITIFSGQVYFIHHNFDTMDFFLIGDCIITTGLCFMTLLRASMLWRKQYIEIVKTFLLSFNLGHYKHKGPYYKEMHETIYKVCNYFSTFSMFMMVGGMILFNLSPIYQNYTIGKFAANKSEDVRAVFSVYYCYPGWDPMEYFFLASVYNFYLTYVCSSFVCVVDLFLFLMVFHIVGHIMILLNNFKILPQPMGMMFDAEENEMIRQKIIDSVQHHREIVTFTNELSSFFGPVLAYNYTFHLGGCCLLLLECSHGNSDALVRFGPLTIITLAQLVQMSVIFEIVGTMSEKLKDAVYDTPWECMDTKNRRCMHILLNRVQTPLHVTAMGLTAVGVTTMAGILRTTFSYFAFLRSTQT